MERQRKKEELNNTNLFHRNMQSAFEFADLVTQPHDSREIRNERAYEYLYQQLGFQVAPAMEYMLREMIENPRLILADVRVYRDHVLKKGHCFNNPDLPKCSIRAAELRREGNRLYVLKSFEGALEKYNESICCAPNESEDLGIGYANRSAVYYEQGEYELTLANIDLAKKHKYPGRLMPKLLARESNCLKMLEEPDETGKRKKCPSMTFNVEPNPRIPFIAKGISARKLPIYGTSLVAEQGFKAGDVILEEKPLTICVNMVNKFIHCHHCLSGNLLHLIPCPNCTSAMYCNEECLQEGLKLHRFECGANAKLTRLIDYLLGPRMFFHGLTLFQDDVDKMMAFCQANKETDKSFLDVDYSNYDPLEEFKVFIGRKVLPDSIQFNMVKNHAAIAYCIFMEVPLVRSLFSTKARKNFMLKCFYDYMHRIMSMDFYREPTNKNGQLYPVASICNHSCDPNTLALAYGGQIKYVVLRPIRSGEQITISYAAHYNQPSSVRSTLLAEQDFDCVCDVCDENKFRVWMVKHKKRNPISQADWSTMHRMVHAQDITAADRMNALQQFVQRYGALHPQKNFSDVLLQYSATLKACHKLGMDDKMRKKIAG